MSPTPTLFDRYLRILGVPAAPPCLDSLRRLVRAHLMRAPFENVSKLYMVRELGLREMPTLERYLDGIERYHFGGTCYANSYYLWRLLRHLGYEADLCGADMKGRADVHAVSMVRLEDREFLVDVGYGAPFYGPLPRDLSQDHVIRFGRDRYVLHAQDPRGRSRLDHYHDGVLVHGYVAKPAPREIGHFEQIIRESYADEATFMNALRLVRFLDRRSVSIYNDRLTHCTARDWQVTRLSSRVAIAAAVERYFQIPQSVFEKAVTDLGELRSIHD